MSRRILLGFLGVLTALLVLVVVPLGLQLTSQERSDFASSTKASAHALAAAAEESLGDTKDPTDRRTPSLSVDSGDIALLLRPDGKVIAVAGDRPAAKTFGPFIRDPSAVRMPHSVLATAVVGSASHPDGRVVLIRDARGLEHREDMLWLSLGLVAGLTVAIGSLVAWLLARWIGRPLTGLQTAASLIGHGDLAARADTQSGPPEVRQVATTFNEMTDRIEALLRHQRSMTADVSHQLRTPLSALRLRLELLAQDAPENLSTDLSGAQREVARLTRLVDGLLAVARAEESAVTPEAVDLDAAVNERVELWQPVAEEKQVVVAASTGSCAVSSTPGHVEQILDNLIANAIDALHPGQRIDVSTARENGQVVLTVRDTGPGMPAAKRASAFARFGGDAEAGKTGLGLAIVARLVRADHGSITLDETQGGGLSVIVRLPAA